MKLQKIRKEFFKKGVLAFAFVALAMPFLAGAVAPSFTLGVLNNMSGSSPGVNFSDLNGDGFMDVAVPNATMDTLSIFLNNGDGTFAAKVDYTPGAWFSPRSVAVGDINGDGAVDMAVTGGISSTEAGVSIFLNNGNGTFAYSTGYAMTNPHDVVLGNFDANGSLDMAVTNWSSPDTLTVFLNNGNGTFAPPVDYPTGGVGLATTPTAGDLNGDGSTDIVVANTGTATFSVFLNNGNGTFAPKDDYTTTGGGTSYLYLAVGDMNSDGKKDVAVVNAETDTLSIFLSDATGTLTNTANPSTGAAGARPAGVTMGDLDADGKMDVVVSNREARTLSLFLSNGDGTFAPKVDYTTTERPVVVAVGNLNADGKIDMAASSYFSEAISTFKNSTGTISVTSNIAASWTINGPTTIVGSGTSQTISLQPTGTYTIVWDPVSGYTAPAQSTQTLTDSGAITFSGTYVAPDLQVWTPANPSGLVIPTTATEGTAVMLSAPVTNRGTASTASGFTSLFQKATDSSGTGAVDIGTYATTSLIAAGARKDVKLSYAFPTAGTVYVRVCADKASSGDTGTIPEANSSGTGEANNCGAWTAITVGVPTGTVKASASISAGSWTISGCTSQTGSGTTEVTYSSVPVGDCTITYDPVSGYTTPGQNTQTLTSGNPITFVGNYASFSGTISVTSNISASWTINGPATITGSGTSQTLTFQPTGTYTIVWDPVSGYTEPSSQNLSLTDGGTITFDGTYVPGPNICGNDICEQGESGVCPNDCPYSIQER